MCKHYDNIDFCNKCHLETKDYFGFNPEIYNFAYEMYKEDNIRLNRGYKITYVNRVKFKGTWTFDKYYKIASKKIRLQKLVDLI